MDACPCNSGLNYEKCCEPYLKGEKSAPTAEALMRSRYSAFATQNVDYIVGTHVADSRDELNPEEIQTWSKSSNWLGLEIIDAVKGQESDTEGEVEFKALYEARGSKITHHERATFIKTGDSWFFVDGKVFNEAIRRSEPKVGRNDPCPCGSGKKYKKCHG